MNYMNLTELIPDNKPNWVIRGNTIYYYHYHLVPILQKRYSDIYVVLDMRVYKSVLKLVKHLVKYKVDFFFLTRSLNPNDNITTDAAKSEIIKNYMTALVNEKFFDNIGKTGLDYVENFGDYIQKTNSWLIFKEEFEKMKNQINRKTWNYYEAHYDVKREDIKNFIVNLEREIKLNMFI